jgi:hypothetical protein
MAYFATGNLLPVINVQGIVIVIEGFRNNTD